MTGDLIFYLLALLTIVPAVWVVFSPNIVHAGFALLFTLFGAAGLYAYMGADFIAVTQLMVYIGGVLVLVLFTVMMTRVPRAARAPATAWTATCRRPCSPWPSSRCSTSRSPRSSGQRPRTEAEPTIAEIGTNFMTNYIFPFEYVSLVLLAAMIGAAILIREAQDRRGRGNRADEDTEVPS